MSVGELRKEEKTVNQKGVLYCRSRMVANLKLTATTSNGKTSSQRLCSSMIKDDWRTGIPFSTQA